jgi:hypothetical protein
MGQSRNGFYAAYALLVIGGGAALMMSERPVSATVVALALFSFNLAAILFVVPQFLRFIERQNSPATTSAANNSDIATPLKSIESQLQALTMRIDALQAAQSERVALGKALATTAAYQIVQSPMVKEIQASFPPPPSSEEIAERARQLAAPTPTRRAEATLPAQPTLFESDHTQVERSSAQVSTLASNLISATSPLAQDIQTLARQAQAPLSPAPVSLRVNAHVGEDDVLCLRGEGAGLNWQEGIPMSYEGENIWSWRASAVSHPISCRIYLNDEISAFGKDIEIRPGQSIEIAPQFPKIEA